VFSDALAVRVLLALTLTDTPAVRPITLGVHQYFGAHADHRNAVMAITVVASVPWNAVMAATVVASVPAALLLVVPQRLTFSGTTGGAVR
jgi:multiple sugar transport system permease protein